MITNIKAYTDKDTFWSDEAHSLIRAFFENIYTTKNKEQYKWAVSVATDFSYALMGVSISSLPYSKLLDDGQCIIPIGKYGFAYGKNILLENGREVLLIDNIILFKQWSKFTDKTETFWYYLKKWRNPKIRQTIRLIAEIGFGYQLIQNSRKEYNLRYNGHIVFKKWFKES